MRACDTAISPNLSTRRADDLLDPLPRQSQFGDGTSTASCDAVLMVGFEGSSTSLPTNMPTKAPTEAPTNSPTTPAPTNSPTELVIFNLMYTLQLSGFSCDDLQATEETVLTLASVSVMTGAKNHSVSSISCGGSRRTLASNIRARQLSSSATVSMSLVMMSQLTTASSAGELSETWDTEVANAASDGTLASAVASLANDLGVTTMSGVSILSTDVYTLAPTSQPTVTSSPTSPFPSPPPSPLPIAAPRSLHVLRHECQRVSFVPPLAMRTLKRDHFRELQAGGGWGGSCRMAASKPREITIRNRTSRCRRPHQRRRVVLCAFNPAIPWLSKWCCHLGAHLVSSLSPPPDDVSAAGCWSVICLRLLVARHAHAVGAVMHSV